MQWEEMDSIERASILVKTADTLFERVQSNSPDKLRQAGINVDEMQFARQAYEKFRRKLLTGENMDRHDKEDLIAYTVSLRNALGGPEWSATSSSPDHQPVLSAAYSVLLAQLPSNMKELADEMAEHTRRRIADEQGSTGKRLTTRIAETRSLVFFIGKKRLFRLVGERKRRVE